MRTRDFVFVVMFAVASAMWAQDRLAQAHPGSGTGNQMRAEERQKMIEMHEQEMEGMRADIEKMKASLAQMKANLFTIKDTNEFSRWRDNVDMWELVITQMDRMQKDMESMEPGMMQGAGVGGPGVAAPTGKKPQ
jgi:hypothetical protein